MPTAVREAVSVQISQTPDRVTQLVTSLPDNSRLGIGQFHVADNHTVNYVGGAASPVVERRADEHVVHPVAVDVPSVRDGASRPTEHVARSLFMPALQVRAARDRAILAGLYSPHREAVLVAQLVEFLLHGVRYTFPSGYGPIVRGVPTSISAAPPRHRFLFGPDAECVWPDPAGDLLGHAIAPLHPRAPEIARADLRMWQLLALVDALRVGSARERVVGEPLLREALAA